MAMPCVTANLCGVGGSVARSVPGCGDRDRDERPAHEARRAEQEHGPCRAEHRHFTKTGRWEGSRFGDHQTSFGLEPLFQQRAVHRAEVRCVEEVFVDVQFGEPGKFTNHFPGRPTTDQERDTAGSVVCPRAIFLWATTKLRPQLDQHPLIQFARFEVTLEGDHRPDAAPTLSGGRRMSY